MPTSAFANICKSYILSAVRAVATVFYSCYSPEIRKYLSSDVTLLIILRFLIISLNLSIFSNDSVDLPLSRMPPTSLLKSDPSKIN